MTGFLHAGIQFQGQYEDPGLDESAEKQNLCLHAKFLSVYLSAENAVADISCRKSHNLPPCQHYYPGL